MPVQIQRNNFTISGNSRSVLGSHAPFNIRQQLDSCAILCRLHRRLKVCAVGRCAVLRHDLYGHLLSASKACAIVIHALMQASVAANSAFAVFPIAMIVGRAARASMEICISAIRFPIMRMRHDGKIADRPNIIGTSGFYQCLVVVSKGIAIFQQVSYTLVGIRTIDRYPAHVYTLDCRERALRQLVFQRRVASQRQAAVQLQTVLEIQRAARGRNRGLLLFPVRLVVVSAARGGQLLRKGHRAARHLDRRGKVGVTCS